MTSDAPGWRPEPQPRILVLTGGVVYDGTGAPPVTADVVVESGVIRAVGPGAAAAVSSLTSGAVEHGGVEHIDATGLEVLPGFVDVHSHDDAALFRADGILPKTQQGVTTVIVGNCGLGCAPSDPSGALEAAALPVLGPFPTDRRWPTFADFLADLGSDAEGSDDLGIGASALVPHAPMRASEIGMERRPATPEETARIAAGIGDALDAGGLGVSLGLMYAPGDAADRPELLAIARETARRDRLLVAHIRNEADHLIASIDELADVARVTGTAIHISHLKVTGPRNAGSMPRVIAHLDTLRDEGIDVTADVYPYDAGSTTVTSLFPPSTATNGVDSLLVALRDPVERAAVLAGLDRPWPSTSLENQYASIGPDRIHLAGFSRPENAPLEGLSLTAIASALGEDPREALADLVLAERGSLTVIVFHTDLAGMVTALAWPHTLVGSDGLPRESGTVHPRLFGTFPRVLERYTGAGRPLSRAEGVRRMTTAASERFRIPHRARGRITGTTGVRPGAAGDLQLIDPARYADRSDFTTPRRSPAGLEGVWVAGRRVR